MKTLYAVSLYLLITCLTSVNGLDGPPLFKIQSVAFKTCITFQGTDDQGTDDQFKLKDDPRLSVVYLDCKFN